MTHIEQRRTRPEKETIHSGHFMVSHFEAEAQDDDDPAAVPVPDEEPSDAERVDVTSTAVGGVLATPGSSALVVVHGDLNTPISSPQQISIETSLTKLFKCMTLAYRQKLTSPKWNRFKGIKLRWKDKIRLNNVIWRCWHMQFIKRKNTLVCQFASPLDVDLHVKPETTILEGKYWKRRAEAVKAEYKKWRMFHMRRLLGRGDSSTRDMISDMDTVETFSLCGDMAGNMLMDEDYIAFMSDTLFSTISSNQPFAFPDTREIARGASLADFIQPSLGPLQPNLDDFMDTLEPLQELLSQSRLPPVPEESSVPPEDNMYRSSVPMDLYTTQPYNISQPLQPALNSTQISSSNQMMSAAPETMPTNVKNERLQSLDPGGRFVPDCPPTLHNTIPQQQQHHSPTYQPVAYDARAHNDTQLHGPYSGKTMRAQYPRTPKILPHPDTSYSKAYSAQVVTPAQSASETASLLQQPMQALNVAPAGRNSYPRERASRPRIAHYTNQLPSAHAHTYSSYTPQPQHHNMGYDARSSPQQPRPPAQLQYTAITMDGYNKGKASGAVPLSFKLPTQNSSSAPSQQLPVSPSGSQSLPTVKESFRSSSLPLGSQLNADWTITSPAASEVTQRPQALRVSGSGGVVRRRSRSSSSGGVVTGSALAAVGSGRRVPPPLASVSSEPTLPQASVMLAQLLTSQHSQSMYKLNLSSEDVSSRPDSALSSPILKQSSPAEDTVESPMHSGSPGTLSPQSPRSPDGPRRATHLHAEQKRRYNIKNGFDTLQAIIPHLNNNPTAKVSKAAMLQKGADYIKQLKAERNQIRDEMEGLRHQIESLNNSISNCHSLLPATGAPVSRARAGRLREMFVRHVSARTLHNWKYWLFSMVATALVESFSNCVSCGCNADLVRSTLLWAEQHCSLVEMRPAVLSSLRVLCTTTDILTNPERLPEEARAAAAAAAVKPEPL